MISLDRLYHNCASLSTLVGQMNMAPPRRSANYHRVPASEEYDSGASGAYAASAPPVTQKYRNPATWPPGSYHDQTFTG